MKENIIIFGASTRGMYVYNNLKNKYNIVAFCDNDNKKWGTYIIDNIIILNPKQLKNRNELIIIASMYEEEIKKQLKKMNIENFKKYNNIMENILEKLSERRVDLSSMDCLEPFGGTGEYTSKIYQNLVKSLEVWEINKDAEETLKNNLPKAKIKITDSFKEIDKINKKYDMILMDNPMYIFNGHCEHFDMYIKIFDIMRDDAIIIFDIIPNLNHGVHNKKYITQEYLLCRKLFYGVKEPYNISLNNMIERYEQIANKNRFSIEWYFIEEKTKDNIQYLVLKIKKQKNII